MSDRLEIRLIHQGAAEKLPVLLARSWRQWHIGPAGLIEIPTANNAGDWLDPRHMDELWMPEGLPAPRAELALQFLIKDGELRYVMPGLTTYLSLGESVYRNRGLRTQPLAHTWVNFLGLQLGTLKLHAFEQAPDDSTWNALGEPADLDACLSALVQVLADGPAPLSQGFHLISVAVPGRSTDLKVKHRYGVALTGAPEPEGVFDLDDAPCGCLCVTAQPSARMSESFRQPEVYQPLIAAEVPHDG